MNEHHPPDDSDREDWLDALARQVREDEAEDRRRYDERWRRLVDDALDEDERAALDAEAARSDEARLDHEAFRPLDDAFHERVLSTIRRRTGLSASTGSSAEPGADVVPVPRRSPPETAAAQVTNRSWLALAAALALAVVGLFLANDLWRPEPSFDAPIYVAELDGQRSETRSPDVANGEIPVFEIDGPFRLLLRPESEVANDPQVAFLLARVGESGDGALRPWDVGYERRPGGTLRIDGTLGEDLPIEPGRFVLVFLYARPGSLPAFTTLAELDEASARARGAWRAVRVPFRVAASESAGLGLDGVPLEVEYAGCYAVSRGEDGSVCVPYAELTFWIRSTPDAAVDLRVGGRSIDLHGPAARAERVDGGVRVTVPVRAEDGAVEVTASANGAESRFRLALVESDEPEWLRDLYERASRGEGDVARESLEAALRDGRADESPAVRGATLGLLARLGGSETEQVERLEEAVALQARSGRLLSAARDLGMLQHLDDRARRFAARRERLDRLAEALPPDAPAEAAVVFGYYRGILENDVGDYRGALAALDEAAEIARRTGLGKDLVKVEAQRALALERLGRSEEAVEHFLAIDEASLASLPPCDVARIENNLGWLLFLSGGALGDPSAIFDRASAIAEKADCPQSTRLHLALNRALAFEQRGDLVAARRALGESEALEASASALHRLWWRDAEGRLALAEGRPADALERYQRMAELADAAFDPVGRWRAAVQRGVAHERLGEAGPALAAYAEAEALLDDESLHVPLDAGRERLAADREIAVRRHVDLLLREERSAEAFEVARRSRSRVLRSIRRGHRLAGLSADEQAVWDLEVARYLDLRAEIEADGAEDWRLPADRLEEARARRAERRAEARRALDRAFRVLDTRADDEPRGRALPPLRPAEIVLAHHPLPAGWVGFAARPGRVDVHRFDLDEAILADRDELSRRLLEPFAAAIEPAESIRVLDYGVLRAIDFHALPWRGDVLLATKPVTYGLDLAPSRGNRRPSETRRALVVGDPRGDLPAARREAEAVAAALGDRAERLDAEAASLSAVRTRLAVVDLVHFAGHGVVAGRSGWESGLLLADGARLGLGDVLALERAPAHVVLSSCESARDPGADVPSLGLAQAFLVAGAERVIAATRPVGDRDTERLFRRLYEGEPSDLAERLRVAQLAWRAEDPAADWASFRVLEP